MPAGLCLAPTKSISTSAVGGHRADCLTQRTERGKGGRKTSRRLRCRAFGSLLWRRTSGRTRELERFVPTKSISPSAVGGHRADCLTQRTERVDEEKASLFAPSGGLHPESITFCKASPLKESLWQREFRCAFYPISCFQSNTFQSALLFPKDILNGKLRASHAVCVACPNKCFTIRPHRWRQGAAGGTKKSCDAFERL